MFIEEYLVELRRERFAPRALLHYAHRVGARVRADWLANPDAVRSIWAVAMVFFAVVFLASIGMALAWDRQLAERFLLETSLWMLPAFAFVILFVGHLRDEQGHRLSGLNLPLMLTLARVSLVPGIALFLVERHFAWALGLYVFASLTDVFDGYLARRWQQTTLLGTLLDPLVDIVFNLTMLADLKERLAAINRERRATFVVIEHNMEFVMSLCSRVMVMAEGKVLAMGSPDEVRANPAVIEAYLGH